MAGGRPKKKIALHDFPPLFRKAIIRFMADHGYDDLEYSLQMLSYIVQNNNKRINNIVNAESERKYRSRHFKELNKTLATRDQTAYDKGYWEAERIYRITYPCSGCGKPIEIRANGPEIETIRQALTRWRHNNCIN